MLQLEKTRRQPSTIPSPRRILYSLLIYIFVQCVCVCVCVCVCAFVFRPSGNPENVRCAVDLIPIHYSVCVCVCVCVHRLNSNNPVVSSFALVVSSRFFFYFYTFFSRCIIYTLSPVFESTRRKKK